MIVAKNKTHKSETNLWVLLLNIIEAKALDFCQFFF